MCVMAVTALSRLVGTVNTTVASAVGQSSRRHREARGPVKNEC